MYRLILRNLPGIGQGAAPDAEPSRHSGDPSPSQPRGQVIEPIRVEGRIATTSEDQITLDLTPRNGPGRDKARNEPIIAPKRFKRVERGDRLGGRGRRHGLVRAACLQHAAGLGVSDDIADIAS